VRTTAVIVDTDVMTETLHVESSLEVLAEVRAHIRLVARRLGADEPAVRGLVQAVDEWVTNVTVHGYRGTPGPVDIDVLRDGPDVQVRIRDAAPVFDPATSPALDPAVPLERRPLGGMGIALIRDLCTTFDHRALPAGGNEVIITRPAVTGLTRGRNTVETSVERVSDSVAIIGLDGELDASNYQGLIDTGQGLYGEGMRTLVLDLTGLKYMASSGIVALHSLALVYRGEAPHDPDSGWEAFHAVQADAESGNRQEQLRLVAPNPAIDTVLDRTGMKQILPIFPDRSAALAG
jgi:serine/threonine-protein kinase RsbW